MPLAPPEFLPRYGHYKPQLVPHAHASPPCLGLDAGRREAGVKHVCRQRQPSSGASPGNCKYWRASSHGCGTPARRPSLCWTKLASVIAPAGGFLEAQFGGMSAVGGSQGTTYEIFLLHLEVTQNWSLMSTISFHPRGPGHVKSRQPILRHCRTSEVEGDQQGVTSPKLRLGAGRLLHPSPATAAKN